jgi:hypothetical protein
VFAVEGRAAARESVWGRHLSIFAQVAGSRQPPPMEERVRAMPFTATITATVMIKRSEAVLDEILAAIIQEQPGGYRRKSVVFG